MPFLSLEFGLFFLVFFPLYWAIARFPNWQNSLLFFSGLGWLWYISPFFAFAVIAFSLIISLLARFIYQAKTQLHKKIGLSTAIIVAILNLSFFKYFDFFRNSIQAVLNLSDLFVVLSARIMIWSRCILTASWNLPASRERILKRPTRRWRPSVRNIM